MPISVSIAGAASAVTSMVVAAPSIATEAPSVTTASATTAAVLTTAVANRMRCFYLLNLVGCSVHPLRYSLIRTSLPILATCSRGHVPIRVHSTQRIISHIPVQV